MVSLRKALLYGFLAWLIPFLAAFVIFPLRESQRPLFESIMPVVIAIVVSALAVRYFRLVSSRWLREGLSIGVLWMAMSIGIDAPLMLLGGPMQMSAAAYLGDIGLTYLMMPVITTGVAAALFEHAKREAPVL